MLELLQDVPTVCRNQIIFCMVIRQPISKLSGCPLRGVLVCRSVRWISRSPDYRNQMWFQYDGVLVHFKVVIRNFLDTRLRWIGRLGPVR